MNLDFSDEQKEIGSEFGRFLRAQDTIASVRTLLGDPEPGYDRALWADLSTQGWLGAAIPERWGGLGLGSLELCLIAEELGRTLAPVPFGSSVFLFAEAIRLFGSDDQRSRWLPQVAGGTVTGCLAANEGAGETLLEPGAKVTGDRLSGVKWPVTDGCAANAAIVTATGPEGPMLYIADLSAGTERTALPSIDQSRGLARIEFANVPVEPLGSGGDWNVQLGRIVDGAAVLTAFEQIGGADRCLEMAVAFAKERIAFGRPIGGFQAIRHKLADLYIHNQIARSHAYHAAWALANEAPELKAAAAAARLAATHAYWEATKENIHVHGGMGFTWEADCHLYYRRAEHLALVLGPRRMWRDRLMGELVAAVT